MEFANPFSATGEWLKGNTHTHTTNSDGRLSPLEISKRYAGWGYDFLVLTDHWKRTELDQCPEDILVISGTEIDFNVSPECSHHVVCFGLDTMWKTKGFESLKEFSEFVKEENAQMIVAHPHWSGARSFALLGLENLLGIEIYNTVCENIGRAYSVTHWDDMLEEGMQVLGFAADDFHHEMEPGGWIMLKAEERTEDAVCSAIRQGLFYSTQGPEIKDIRIEDDEITVECSACKRINFMSKHWHGQSFTAPSWKPISKATHKPKKDALYVRIECIDHQGRTAWSNPIYLDPTPNRIVNR